MDKNKSFPKNFELEQDFPYKVPFLTFYGAITSSYMARISYISDKLDLDFNTVLHHALTYGLMPDKDNKTFEDKIKELYE